MLAVEQGRNPNLPTERQGVPRMPERRHFADRLNVRSVRHTDENTVIMPWVNVMADIQAIAEANQLRYEKEDWAPAPAAREPGPVHRVRFLGDEHLDDVQEIFRVIFEVGVVDVVDEDVDEDELDDVVAPRSSAAMAFSLVPTPAVVELFE